MTLGADVLGSTYKNVQPYGFTLTRLHARYGKDVKDDLVFRAVKPIEGGRGIPAANGAMDTHVQMDAGTNNFQGRYVILHPWDGPIACASPQRGRWGGPNGSQQIGSQAATNLAFAPRGASLASFVSGDVPTVGVLSSGGAALPNPVRQPQGCGCRTEGGAQGLVGFAVLGLWLRRRRR
jgi:MYXO-CTERM domain-containing protein